MNNMFQKKNRMGSLLQSILTVLTLHPPTNQPISSAYHIFTAFRVSLTVFAGALPTGEITLPLPLKSFATCTKHGGNRHVAGLYLLATILFDGWKKVSCVDFLRV